MSILIILGDIPSSIVTHGCLNMSLSVILSPASNMNILFNRSHRPGLIDTFRHSHSDQKDSLGSAEPLRLPLTPRPLKSASLICSMYVQREREGGRERERERERERGRGREGGRGERDTIYYRIPCIYMHSSHYMYMYMYILTS